jgi:hypothetical protein
LSVPIGHGAFLILGVPGQENPLRRQAEERGKRRGNPI